MIIDLGSFEGVSAYRFVELSGQRVAEHRHDSVAVTIPVIGRLKTVYDGGDVWLAGAAVVAHPAGSIHAGIIDATGTDTVEVEFEADWLASHCISVPDRTCWATGGAAGAAALALARSWLQGSNPRERLATAKRLFTCMSAGQVKGAPEWLHEVQSIMCENPVVSVSELAQLVGLTPNWLSESYRAHVGEGIQATLRRRRVESATLRLRYTAEPLAEIACSTGFCDQSHMNRIFRAHFGSSPLEVRREAQRAGEARSLGD